MYQSAITKLLHSACARRSARLNRRDRKRQSPRPVGENSVLNHRTGRPSEASITSLMTHEGYDVSRREMTSLVPSATTNAVVFSGIEVERTRRDWSVRRPTLALMTTRSQIFRRCSRDSRFPNACVPTVRLSPTKNNAPCPLSMAVDGVRRACSGVAVARNVVTSRTVIMKSDIVL